MLPDKKTKMPKKGNLRQSIDTTSVFGYAANNKKNNGPICTVDGVAFVNDVGVDGKGNLMLPYPGSPTTDTLDIHQGPTMCGKPIRAYRRSLRAALGRHKPECRNRPDRSRQPCRRRLKWPGSLSICTFKGGCTVNLTNSAYFHVGGVGMSNSGDCWIDVKTSASGGVELVYYKGCAGNGAIASGFQQTYYGGIDIDKSGNLVIIDDMAEDVAPSIAAAIQPARSSAAPFALKGESFWGDLFSRIISSRQWTVHGSVDVYSYSTKNIKFIYSYNSGLSAALLPNGVAVNPRSKQ